MPGGGAPVEGLAVVDVVDEAAEFRPQRLGGTPEEGVDGDGEGEG